MARIRTLKPEIFASPQVMNLALAARLLFVGLILQADDDGRGSADPRKLRAAVFPGDRVKPSAIARWLEQMAREGLIRLYEAAPHGRLYALPTWKRHQRIDKPRASAYPPPPDSPKPRRSISEASATPPGSIAESSATSRRGSEGSEGSEGIGSDARARGLRGARAAPEARKPNGPVEIRDFVRRMPGMPDAEIAQRLDVDEAAVRVEREALA